MANSEAAAIERLALKLWHKMPYEEGRAALNEAYSLGIERGISQERERCAKKCDDRIAEIRHKPGSKEELKAIAVAIRNPDPTEATKS